MKKITEKQNIASSNINDLNIYDILCLINKEDAVIHGKIYNVLPLIEKLIISIVSCLNNGGRLFYIGCGTSGRLGVLDAAECPPTFSTDHSLVQGIIAGGKKALYKSVENAEDNFEDAKNIIKNKVKKNDIVIGLSASGTSKFVLSGLKEAHKIKVKTGLITCNLVKDLSYVDHLIKIIVGPEIITGSTRMKSGTATKMVLNMISTVSMIKMNKTYNNYMVDLKISNEKLFKRGINIICEITGESKYNSMSYLKKTKGNVKLAIVMILLKINKNKAKKLLKENNENLNTIINN